MNLPPLDPAAPPWQAHAAGDAALVRTESGLRFLVAAGGGRYANAQIDDHTGLRRAAFRWRPPVTLEVRARFSAPAGALHGTAGFGFWNDPFGMGGSWPPALPQAAWFFCAGAESDLPLAQGVPGRGWKAAVIDARRSRALALIPAAPLAPLLRSRALRQRLWPPAQRALGIDEAIVPEPATAWRTYRLLWRQESVTFSVDGRLLLESRAAPRGPLGLVIWMDTQYLVAAPEGRLRHGVAALPAPQWMEIAGLRVGAG